MMEMEQQYAEQGQQEGEEMEVRVTRVTNANFFSGARFSE